MDIILIIMVAIFLCKVGTGGMLNYDADKVSVKMSKEDLCNIYKAYCTHFHVEPTIDISRIEFYTTSEIISEINKLKHTNLQHKQDGL